MTYPWFDFVEVFGSLGLPVVDVSFTASGDGSYKFAGAKRKGSLGKTCWYLPLLPCETSLFGVRGESVGLKVIRYPVYNDIRDEYNRLLQEFTIQKILHSQEMAPDVFRIVLVRNEKSNSVSWLGQTIEYPAGSVFFALLVEHVDAREQISGVGVNADGALFGSKVAEFEDRCRRLRIEPYDLTCENVYQVDDRLAVLDVHKWRRTYGMRSVPMPKYLQIELNNTCNAKCSMCAIPNMTRARGMMSDALFEKIIQEAGELGIEHVTPFLHGEPFARKDFVDKLKRVNELAPKALITIFTNASLLDEKALEGLAEIKNIEQIVFSFPGGNKEVYEITTGLKFENSVRNIKRAFQLLQGINLRISMPRCRQNRDSEDDFAILWDGYPHSAYDSYNYIGDAQGSLAGSCYEQCDRAFRSMTVLFDGRVCLCCMDSDGKYIMGDLSKDSILDVWNGPPFVKLREEHGRCRMACEPCSRCTQDLKTEEYNDAYHSSLA